MEGERFLPSWVESGVDRKYKGESGTTKNPIMLRILSSVRAGTLSQLVVALVVSHSFATVAMTQPADLGAIDFSNSGSSAAQEPFLRGVLLLHSFEYSDASEAFRKAQEADSEFALAYWGEALTYSHLLWSSQDLSAGRAALSKLDSTRASRSAKAPTEREKAYLEAAEILYGDGETRSDRFRAYRDAMSRLHQRFPEDHEAAAFYAVSIIGAVNEGRDHAEYMKAAGVAEQVFAANPRHPGAVHYLIHAYDDPEHAPLGMRPARVYAKIAPAASHALHMPSHIFVASGLWDEVVASNRASWASSVARMKRKGLGVDEKGFHALLWLHYGLTQLGESAEAEDILRQMKADAAESGSRRTRYHLAAMAAHHLVETEDWDNEEALSTDVQVSDLGVSAFAGYQFALGFAAVRRGVLDEAQASMDAILQRLDRESGDNEDRKRAGVMASELLAMIDLAHGDVESAIETLRDAVEAEESISYSYGPPEIIKPSAELLGEVLLEQGECDAAAAAFDRAIERTPGRRLSGRGLTAAVAEDSCGL